MDKFSTMGAGLADFALRRPVTICMLFFSMLVLGLISSRLLPLEKWPGIEIPELFIVVPYQDATPAEVEKMITRPIEEALATISGIKRLRSRSSEDQAEIQLQFAWDENINAKSIEAREKVDAIRNQLPSDVQRIQIFQFNTTDFPIFQLRVSSERDLSNAYDLLDRNLKMPMERVEGVSRVELYGVLKKQISIRVDPERMAALHVNTGELTQTLLDANFSMTAGSFLEGDQKVTVNPMGEYRSVQDISDLYIAKGIRLSDVAQISYETPRRTEGRHLDQTYAVGFNIFRESGSNLVDVSKRVMKVVEAADKNPAFNGINLFVMQDEAQSVTDSLSDLLEAGLLGALLSLLVLYAFLRHVASTLIVVLSVPFSICITLGCMYFMGYSINILSLMGLMLAVGMLVDNAVVVTESIFQEKQKISDAVVATKKGVASVSLAIIAGTTTTAIVFMPNIVGKKIDVTIFLEHVAVAICISLFASLLIAQTLIPLLTSKIKQAPSASNKGPGKLMRGYGGALSWVLNNQGKSFLLALLLLGSVAIPMQFVTSGEEDEGANNQIWLNYNVQGSYTLDEVEKTVSKIEAYLYGNQERFHIKSVYSYYTAGFAVSGITLNDNLPIKKGELKKLIKEGFPPVVRARPTFQWDEGNGGGVRLTLLGQSSERLMSIADSIIPVLANIDGLTDVKADVDGQKEELQVRIDRRKAFRFGLTSEEVANTIATALRGSNLRTFRNGGNGEVGVRLMFDESLQQSLDKLRNLPLSRSGTQSVTLDMVAEITVAKRLSQIQRFYRQTALSIGANLENDLALGDAEKRIKQVMEHIDLPTGYQWSLDGSFKRQQEAENVMIFNMLLAVCMIYIVMAALFESLLLPTAVITSLLFSVTGVFWAFLLTGTQMSIMGMIGMLILMGIVVNNGIVLVDRINQLRDSGMAVKQAIIEGSMNRVRPIMMTVATTVLGLIPLAMGNTQIGGDGPAYSPMAIAIIGGLVLSTATSLLLVPLAYILLLRLKAFSTEVQRSSRHVVDRVIKAS